METAPGQEHQPRKYSKAQHLSTTVKVIGAAILFGGLLWLLDVAVSK
ncbi:MAG TPA: hypothetical protein VHD76_04480 [Bryobacteraceae bacterium]|jgi:hypothetical protein|nr:hypothetical protein [Bryobacteraceae bacterium]